MEDLEKDNTQDTGVKEDAAAAPAAEPQANQPVPEPQPQSAPEPTGSPSTDGGVTPAGKMYTEAELNAIMHERTKGFSSVKKELESYKALGSVDELSKVAKKPASSEDPAPSPALDPDDQKFVAYLKRVLPELSRLEALGKLEPQQLEYLNDLRQREETKRQDYVNRSEQEIYTYCDTKGIKDESARVMTRDLIAVAIMNSPALAARWRENDPSVVSEAVKILGSTLNPAAAPAKDMAALQTQAAAKAKAAVIKPPLPTGGVAAPITKDRKLTDDERVDAAWNAIKNKVS